MTKKKKIKINYFFIPDDEENNIDGLELDFTAKLDDDLPLLVAFLFALLLTKNLDRRGGEEQPADDGDDEFIIFISFFIGRQFVEDDEEESFGTLFFLPFPKRSK